MEYKGIAKVTIHQGIGVDSGTAVGLVLDKV